MLPCVLHEFLLPLYYEGIKVCNIFKGINWEMASKHPAVSVAQNPSKCLLSYVSTHMPYYHYTGILNYNSDYDVPIYNVR